MFHLPLFHSTMSPSPHSHTQKGRPYPTYLPPGQDSQHEVCHHPLRRSYAGSTKTVQHSENKRAPAQGGGSSTQNLLSWEAHD